MTSWTYGGLNRLIAESFPEANTNPNEWHRLILGSQPIYTDSFVHDLAVIESSIAMRISFGGRSVWRGG
jgi:hypothetical protein